MFFSNFIYLRSTQTRDLNVHVIFNKHVLMRSNAWSYNRP